MSASVSQSSIPGSPALMVDQGGSGELLLFLHGIGGNRSNWAEQVAAFSPTHRTVALDIRGYGGSEDYAGAASFDIFADDVVRVLDFFGATKAHICGLSLGGRIAQRFYSRHPARVASLILADSRPDTVDTRSKEDRDAFFNSRAKPLMEGKKPSEIAESVARSLAAPQVSTAALERLIASISALRSESYLKAIRANLDDDYVGNVGAISVPTLIIVGEHDKLTPPDLSRQINRDIPGSELVVIPGAGHLSNIENPSAFNAAVAAFLARLPPSRAQS
ncbi:MULTISPECIES: alpha/beta fold hydrolase [unclassified Chelatococcus]|uniref:alpha/beta fold hydrolase n=1 Tax=unclassified Chelatococcus TaxID=2638111 RepID=UPI001BD0689F|nr:MULTISPECIES: alpha/beta fold hydrolase [unclassified Chelatococcus]MBS7700706.1 alpha/beta fold hydrolase [Chelatococcus sp. YT9]MBX3559290.1 alpha/beta fold hydrolase [Chelatococcus sp.]